MKKAIFSLTSLLDDPTKGIAGTASYDKQKLWSVLILGIHRHSRLRIPATSALR
jgi:hypothetical protein